MAGGWVENKKKVSVLVYAKSDSIKLLKRIYHDKNGYFLARKYEVVKRFWGRVAELV